MFLPLKISIVTAVYNRASTIEQAIESVQSQNWPNIEHLVVDGGSTDGTLQILQSCIREQTVLISEPDEGLYDALNKGFARATGDVIGVMHSDDFFANDSVLTRVATSFIDPDVGAAYGDLDYVGKSDTSRIIRRWRPGNYNPAKLARGWMPPHPTLYLRRSVIERWGGFDTRYKVAADYDAILRYFGQGKILATYIPHVMVKMRIGGASNRSVSKIWLKTCEDYAALRSNGVGGMGSLIMKNVGKLGQFI